MSRPSKLSESEIATRLQSVPRWRIEGGKLHREYKFGDFVEAFGFMASVALVAERMNHHPEWFNVWSMVRVHLTTHDAGGLSANDFELATAMDAIAARMGH
jgi:4a-hydroxytetrahydrobiopterin dehydratase